MDNNEIERNALRISLTEVEKNIKQKWKSIYGRGDKKIVNYLHRLADIEAQTFENKITYLGIVHIPQQGASTIHEAQLF